MKSQTLLALIALSWASTVSAACNNPKNWLESPNEGVKTFVGYKQELPYGFTSQMTGDLPGYNPQPDLPYPPPLPAEMLNKSSQGKLSKETNFISYYEPDGKGNWRVCRMEIWVPRGSDPVEKTEPENQGKNPLVRQWLKTDAMGYAAVYLYDAKGRIAETFHVSSDRPKESGHSGERECFHFDAKDRPALYVRATSSNACPKGDKPDPRDFSERFRYMELKDGRVTDTWGEQHFGEPDGSWEKRISFHIPFDLNNKDENLWFQGGNARADPVKGVTQILGGYRLGEKDESMGPTYKVDGNEQPSEYYFTKPPVPISMLETPEKIYDYDRRREADVTSIVKLVEFFPAGKHRVRDRFYTAVGNTVRQEQYDEAGKLKRVINLGKFSRQDLDTGFYDEDMKRISLPLKLKGHEIFYRVWDYNDAGKGKLVAIGWNDKLTFGKHERLDSATIIYGTPDGVPKWKSKEEFFKAFDFDPNASRAYPKQKNQE
jgi:hypothetical protein